MVMNVDSLIVGHWLVMKIRFFNINVAVATVVRVVVAVAAVVAAAATVVAHVLAV